MPPCLVTDISTVECSGSASANKIESKSFTSAHVVLEGNICAGKSTLCALLQKDLGDNNDVRVQSELTEENFLTAFYGNMKKYGFAFQMFMFSTRVFQVEEGARLAAKHNALVLTDRGVLGDWCFARKNWIDGNMSEDEYAIYKDVASKRALCELPEKVDCTVYLDVDPEQCCWRMRHLRKTAAEQGVLQEYMTGIDDCYFEGILEMLSQDGKALILRWDKFGEAGDVQQKLRDTLDGSAPCATVRFVSEEEARCRAASCPEDEDNWIDTPAAIEEAYKRIQDITAPPSAGLRSTQRQVYIRNDMCLEEPANPDAPTTRTNKFKRVVMYHLSLGSMVVLYSSDFESEDVVLSPDSAYSSTSL